MFAKRFWVLGAQVARRNSRQGRASRWGFSGKESRRSAVAVDPGTARRWKTLMGNWVVWRRNLPQLAALVALAAPTIPALAQTATWQGGTGNWNDTGQWDNGTVPGSTNDVFIDGGKTGTDSVANVNVNSAAGNLTIDAGDAVDINNGRTLTIHGATILNEGEIGITSTGGFTTLSAIPGLLKS